MRESVATTVSRARRKFLHQAGLTALTALIPGMNQAKSHATAGLSRDDLWPPVRSLDDPYIELEQLDSKAVDAWVKAQTTRTIDEFGVPAPVDFADASLSATPPEQHDFIICSRWGDWGFSSWREEEPPLSFIARTPWSAWLDGAPEWELLFDIGSLDLNQQAHAAERWTMTRFDLVQPDGERALIHFAQGGSDAHIVREFDIASRRFVEDGFVLDTPGHHFIDWIDRDAVYVGTDARTAGAPASRPHADTPRQVRKWRRGEPLTQAEVVFEAVGEDLYVSAAYDVYNNRHLAWRHKQNNEIEHFWLDAIGEWQRYDVPHDMDLAGEWNSWLFMMPRTEWRLGAVRYAGGSLLAIRRDDFVAGSRRYSVLFSPTAKDTFTGIEFTKRWVIISHKRESATRIVLWQPHAGNSGTWTSRKYPLPPDCSATLSAVDRQRDDTVLIQIEAFLTTPKVYFADLSANAPWRLLDEREESFDITGLTAQRRLAISNDGTRIPYWVIGPEAALEGHARPCLLTGYGGFGVVMDTPSYLDHVGTSWLEPGGVYVVAGIRGGGEHGPDWHSAAQREKRQVAFDDFIAVSEALINSGVTTQSQLAIEGGSNGGLLTAACMVQRPDLFGAVVSRSALLDMLRYHQMLRGAMWLDEYGDPDNPTVRHILMRYSPYHNVRPGVPYPPVLFMASTNDDRVHPGHARKMVAKMQAQGHGNVWYLESPTGGHGGLGLAPDIAERAIAIKFEFLWRTIGAGRRLSTTVLANSV